MWLLKPRAVVDLDTAAWHVENFEWLGRQFARNGRFARTPLVLPQPGFFLTTGERGHALAERIFLQVKRHCGMDDWEVDLIEDDNPLARAPVLGVGTAKLPRYALGTFGASGNRVQITYVRALLQKPEQLIATFAHELAHYLLLQSDEWPICSDDEKECLTDLTAVFMGFGVFLANARFQMEPFSDGAMQGWRMGHSGYLPEADLIFALALFLRAKEFQADDACRSLKPHLAGLLRRAMKQLPPNHADVSRIRAAVAGADAEPPPALAPAR